jgi:hypothetical protein
MDQTVESCDWRSSEQAEYEREARIGGPQEITFSERVRTLEAQLGSAERQIGSRHIGTLRERVHFILRHARAHGVSPRAYAMAWFVWRTTGPLMLSSNVPIESNQRLSGLGNQSTTTNPEKSAL